jgi:hypothetical protein
MSAPLNAAQADRRFQELQKLHRNGVLNDETYRVEVAKLLWRDTHGVFWMPDAESEGWFCNRGDGWVSGDPHAEPHLQAVQPGGRKEKRRSLGRLLLASILSLTLLAVATGIVVWRWPQIAQGPVLSTPTEPPRVRVTIASPADQSQVALGQVVAIEATIEGMPNLQGVAHAEFRVDDQPVATQPVQTQVQPGQASLPLSQPWRPTALGEYQVTITAYSTQDEPLGTATISLVVVEAPEEVLSEAACTPGAAFVADVTIPAGTAFPPGARMDKVWQVRNSGSCAWGVGHELVLVEGEDLGAPHAVPVPPTAAGEMADLALTFWAPAETGVYANAWQLQAPDGQFFGPTLPLSIQVEVQAVENLPPQPPANLQATTVDDGNAVRLTWEDQSDNEDAFRIYREDVKANIGLAPADSEQFVDQGIACGHTYRYTIIAFNAAGTSATSEEATVTLPPCASPIDLAPTLILTVVPTQVIASETFTVVFQANDDLGMSLVRIQGQDTADPTIDAGRVFTCTDLICTGTWPLIWVGEVSTTVTITLTATAQDSAGQESPPARTMVAIRPPE